MSRLTRDGTAEPISRDQILRHARGQGNIIFPVQLTTSKIGNLTRLIHTLLYVMTIHTYIHPLARQQLSRFFYPPFLCWAHTTTTTAVYTFLFSLSSCKPPLLLSVTASSHKTASDAVPLQLSRKSNSRTSLSMKSNSSPLSPLVIEPSRGPGMVDFRKSSPFASGNR